MRKKNAHVSETPATQVLRQHQVAFTEHPYDYVEHGGTAESARQLGLDEHAVVNAATPRKTPTDLRKVTRFTSLGNG